LCNASGRVLARDIISQINVPGFARSAMDGYAVISSDTYGASMFEPRILKKVGTIHAGEYTKIKLNEGECIQISTGAMLPQNADSVVQFEDTEIIGDSDKVNIHKSVAPGTNVSSENSDIKKGTKVLSRGTTITPRNLGILASLGFDSIEVFEKPKILIVPTGNEIVEVGNTLNPGFVYNSNSYTISALVEENGGIPLRVNIVNDSHEDIMNILSHDADLILISGGSSVGEKDILHDLLKSNGKVIFHGVQVKPGKPTLFGIFDNKIVFGLPGYPTACIVVGYVFIVPAVRKLAGLEPQKLKTVKVEISRKLSLSTGRRQFIPVKIENGKAIPIYKESGAITSIAYADGYIEIPENVNLIEKNEIVEVRLF
jgi:molybdenum cofactor synthesis domain-containing protein